jgi:prepilin-type N-terminal cleavage/methylation domain-containing protein
VISISPFKPKLARVTTVQGFTLIEMMVVMSIMGILLALTSIGLQAVLGTEFGSEASDLANTFVRARAYAMANNTYVFVGIQEVDASVPTSTAPQTAGNGRLGVAVVASNDGTRGYDSTAPTAIPVAPTTLSVVSPLRRFENIHLLTTSPIAAAKLPNQNGSTYNVQSTGSLTTFQWPLGGGSGTQYNFGTAPGSVIQFNPQGEAQILPTGTTDDSILKWIELDLQPTHGKTLPVAVSNAATILIDGPSGSVTLYRP